MAEYNMSYEEVKEFIDDVLLHSEESNYLEQYRAEILAAFTAKDDLGNSNSEMKESIELWENQLGKPSELLLGTRYIVVKDCLLAFFKMAATSGAMDMAIQYLAQTGSISMMGISISTAANVFYGLVEIFKSVAQLEDYDFCVYLQAVTHFKTHQKFTLQDLQEWFPHGDKKECNMHNSEWNCEYLNEQDMCEILDDSKLLVALESLEKKGLLSITHENKQDFYVFKW